MRMFIAVGGVREGPLQEFGIREGESENPVIFRLRRMRGSALGFLGLHTIEVSISSATISGFVFYVNKDIIFAL